MAPPPPPPPPPPSAHTSTTLHRYPLGTSPASDGEAHLTRALEYLQPHLPVSIPVYRRLQFGRFFADSCIITNLNLDEDSNGNVNGSSNRDSAQQSTPWLLAFVDRSCRPETELWMFGSWEASPSSTAQDWTQIDKLLLSLVKSVASIGVPPSIHASDTASSPSSSADATENTLDSVGHSRADYAGHANNANIMLWGAVHESTSRRLGELGCLSQAVKMGFVPNWTFVFNIDELAPVKALPEGLVWGEVKREWFGLVRSRTQIPRQEKTMAVLPSLAVYEEETGRPAGWVFVGLDGSLTTLHVEEEWRGKGLAKALTTKLFNEKMDRFHTGGAPRLGHGYVIVGNKQSEGMCRSLGGVSEWESFWLRVDLSTQT